MKNFCHFIVLRFFYIKNITISGLIFFIYYSINIIRGRIFCYGSSITIINGSSLAGTVRVVWWTLFASLTRLTPNFVPVPIITAKLTKKQQIERQPISSNSSLLICGFPLEIYDFNGKAYDSFFPGFHILLRRSNIFIIQLQVLWICNSGQTSDRINSLTSCLASSSSVFFLQFVALTLVKSLWTWKSFVCI